MKYRRCACLVYVFFCQRNSNEYAQEVYRRIHETASVGPEPDSQDTFKSPVRPVRVEIAALPRALLTFDGANEQIEPIMRSNLGKICQAMNIGLFKWAAACSLVQQPNDVSPCHKIVHEHKQSYTEGRSMPPKFGWITAIMDKHKLAPGHKKTFTDFFASLQDLLHDAFTPTAVAAGWRVAGAYSPETGGIDTDAIMGGWNPGSRKSDGCWENMSDAIRADIRSTFDKLADIGMAKGEISDAEIESCVCASGKTLSEIFGKHILAADIPDWMKVQCEAETAEITGKPGVGVNLRRCILLTHANWLAAAKASRIAAGKGAEFDHSRSVLCAFYCAVFHMRADADAACRVLPQKLTKSTLPHCRKSLQIQPLWSCSKGGPSRFVKRTLV